MAIFQIGCLDEDHLRIVFPLLWRVHDAVCHWPVDVLPLFIAVKYSALGCSKVSSMVMIHHEGAGIHADLIAGWAYVVCRSIVAELVVVQWLSWARRIHHSCRNSDYE